MRVSRYSRIIIRMTVIILLAPSIAFIAWYMSVDLSKNDRFSHVCWKLVWLAICCCYRWSFPLSDCSKVDTLRRCRLSRQSGHRSACYPRQAGEATSSLNAVSWESKRLVVVVIAELAGGQSSNSSRNWPYCGQHRQALTIKLVQLSRYACLFLAVLHAYIYINMFVYVSMSPRGDLDLAVGWSLTCSLPN